jgi:hypothetical protein
MKMSVPSIAYALQNNLDFIALSNLDAGVYQVHKNVNFLVYTNFAGDNPTKSRDYCHFYDDIFEPSIFFKTLDRYFITFLWSCFGSGKKFSSCKVFLN